ncbi:DOPA 4,5-dioxygenase family protein [Aurantiacibacter sp. MUD61]|uniref:DOPA 4,5-dioxygenase family protein n=1 Tax=Aurantiacibacter sp. MUD61 TaxID=3009083 RepID=UPI0022F0DBEB|nr:DOPA 4,5-dioxygenase family protein [Aurantiacibacter sp. MUD61]
MALKGFHAHIYYDADEVDLARDFAAQAKAQFKFAVGHFHIDPIGPHPRGSCQLSLGVEEFGRFAPWAAQERGDLTIFAHGLSGDDWADHTQHVIWFGPSEELDLSIFRQP